MARIFALMALLVLGMGGFGAMDAAPKAAHNEQHEAPKSYEELVAIFERYGISGADAYIPDSMGAEYGCPQFDATSDRATAMLMLLGWGEYDYDTLTFTPSRNGVYSFDMEVFNVEGMYTEFLTGVSSLDEGELDFRNIREDTSRVNWDWDTGVRTATFEWKGEEFTIKAHPQGDWFDMSAANQLSAIIKENGSGKRLFFIEDSQCLIVLYRDKAWAAAFQKETGLELCEYIH